jgi:hypothetical protein
MRPGLQAGLVNDELAGRTGKDEAGWEPELSVPIPSFYATNDRNQVSQPASVTIPAKRARGRGLYHRCYVAEWFLYEGDEAVILRPNSLKMR